MSDVVRGLRIGAANGSPVRDQRDKGELTAIPVSKLVAVQATHPRAALKPAHEIGRIDSDRAKRLSAGAMVPGDSRPSGWRNWRTVNAAAKKPVSLRHTKCAFSPPCRQISP